MQPGLCAYETFVAMKLAYLSKSDYDPWKYGFKTRSAETMFNKNPRLKYAYVPIERAHSSKVDQVKFFFPYFLEMQQRANDLDIIKIKRQYAAFTQRFTSRIDDLVDETILRVKTVVATKDDLLDASGTLPVIYTLYDELLTYDQAVLLYMIFPDLNSVVSNDPIVYDKFKRQVDIDKRFYSLYIDGERIKSIQDRAIQQLMS